MDRSWGAYVRQEGGNVRAGGWTLPERFETDGKGGFVGSCGPG